ncbi:hypothetical protein [Aurantiacibacter hainanensis]|uniref:hypothetical protein n=1 Tax=Aurantiacibacter hainanensis TaxID=3076114 RepID=UPI0030C717E2
MQEIWAILNYPGDFTLAGIWIAAVFGLAATAIVCAWCDRMPRLVYRCIFQPLEICVALGPAGLIAALAFNHRGETGEAVVFIFAVLTFFATILAIERWSRSFFHYAADLRAGSNADR